MSTRRVATKIKRAKEELEAIRLAEREIVEALIGNYRTVLKNIDDGGPAQEAVQKAAAMTAEVRHALEGLDDEAPVDEVAQRLGGKVSPAVLAMAKALLVQAGGLGAVTKAVELVGCSVLADTLRTVRRHGTVCFTGALAGQWSIPDFSPFMIPVGVRLTSYAGQATDLPAEVFARQLQAIAEGRLKVPVAQVHRGLEQVRDAQAGVESGTTPGKHVVVLED